MAQFYNPFHFVPVETPADEHKVHDIDRKVFKSGELPERHQHVTHERYVPGTVSGRLIVRLRTVTPTVVGGEQDRDPKGENFARVKPYKVDGRPAIPGSSLRGLIGSLIEAASNGPLRVLDDRSYSYRKQMDEALSAIGIVVNDADGNPTRLKALCLPMLESQDGGRTFAAPPRFRKIFGDAPPQFKVFFGDSKQIRSELGLQFRTSPDPLSSRLSTMPVKQLNWHGNGVAADRSLRVKANLFAIAQDPDTQEPPRDGVVRVLGCWGDRLNDIPRGKKHELWLPVPHPKIKALKIQPEAIERFHQLALERTEEDPRLPFEPLDSRPDRESDRKAHRDTQILLQAGDLVYFDVNEREEVTEIALSAIWRGRVEDRATRKVISAHRFFQRYSSDLLPFSRDRTQISLAEQMLGFAEEAPERNAITQKEQREEGGLALASRLRFADALAPESVAIRLEKPVPLKILGSPKVPCPVLYFKPASGAGAYVEKRNLDPEKHSPQGRKWYLHAQVAPGAEPWRTLKDEQKTRKQKNKVDPIAGGHDFYFHVDFDNLTELELGLLLFAIEPDVKFHHKLGMGKPLGLGSVKLEVAGLFRVDRQQRYSLAGLRGERYTAATFGPAGEDAAWRSRYPREAGAAKSERDELVSARTVFDKSALLPQSVRHALLMLGDYGAAPMAQEVRYPTVADQKDRETEHFRWFVLNERGRGIQRQFLKPLSGERSLPALTEIAPDGPARR